MTIRFRGEAYDGTSAPPFLTKQKGTGMWSEFEIWSGGYVATGEDGSRLVTYHGNAFADTFEEACKELAKTDSRFGTYYDERKNTFWGCALYKSKLDAEIGNIRNFS